MTLNWSMLRYFTSILFLLFSCTVMAQDDADDEAPAKPVVRDSFSQLRLEMDIYRPITSYFAPDKKSYELALDYYFKKDIYFAIDGGWGNASFDNTSLVYNSKNTFFKAGVNKSILLRLNTHDWDMAFVGLRYAVSFVERGSANYTIINNFWGNTNGARPAKNFTGHWFELVGGARLELFKGIFMGWTVRGKFLINQKPFKELPPSYMAGYGKGDKKSVFDFNFYLGYALRWRRH